MTALNVSDLPTTKEETWKYTDISRAIPRDLVASEPDTKVIHIPRGQICEQIEDIIWVGQDGKEHKPSLKIVLEEGAQLTICEKCQGEGAYWTNMVTDIELGTNAKLIHYRLQDESQDAVQTNMVHISLNRDSIYQGFSLNQGAKLFRHQIHAELKGENIECTFNGVNILKDVQHGDTTILIEHQAPHCQSNQDYRTVLDDQARGVFQGKVHVHQIAQKTDGYQLSNALLLSDGAEMDTKPELEIYADDVKCSHGATTGKLDETPLFYLQSRGIPEKEARSLLIQSFVGEVVDKIEDENIRALMEDQINQWLRNA